MPAKVRNIHLITHGTKSGPKLTEKTLRFDFSNDWHQQIKIEHGMTRKQLAQLLIMTGHIMKMEDEINERTGGKEC